MRLRREGVAAIARVELIRWMIGFGSATAVAPKASPKIPMVR